MTEQEHYVAVDPKDWAEAVAELPEHLCGQCGKVMGAEYFLGPVCGACCRKNHRKATGRR